MPVTEWLTVGEELSRETAEHGSVADKTYQVLDERTARVTELVGQRAGKLNGAVVGGIGCGCLGSPAVHILVGRVVRRFVLVDPKFFAPSNIGRMHANPWRILNAKPLKI